MIPYSTPKVSDFYTLSQSKLIENYTLYSGICLYSPYMVVMYLLLGEQFYITKASYSW